MRLKTFITGMLLTSVALAQVTSFPKPNWFRETFQRAHTKVELRDPVKLRDFVVDGKLELSLKHYLELVMSNNTDIQIQMLSLEVPTNAIQMAMGVWDPSVRATFNTTRTTSYVTNPSQAIDSAAVNSSVKSLNQPYTLQYTQTLSNGTQYTAGFTGQKTSSSAVTPRSYNLGLQNTGLAFNLTQPLLRNRGTYVNRIPLMQAQSNLRVSEFTLRSQLLTLVNTAEAAYWSVISARETLKVQEQARDVSAAYLKYMQDQLDLGALSPLDIFNPKAALAAAEFNVSQARFNLAQSEDVLRRQIAADLDPEVRKLPVVLTEPVELGAGDQVSVDREDAVTRALSMNPVIKAAAQKLDTDDLGIQAAKNGLLPSLNLTGGYQASGRGGSYITPFLEVIPGGIGDALGQLFGFGYPTYQAGLILQLPIRSRAASATMANAVVQKKQDSLTLRTQQQSIRLQVLNAMTSLEGAKEQLKLAITQREYSQKNLDAMNEKYRLGTEINQNVIRAQQDLAQAELNVVNAQISVRRSLLNMLTQTGELLDQRGIVVK